MQAVLCIYKHPTQPKNILILIFKIIFLSSVLKSPLCTVPINYHIAAISQELSKFVIQIKLWQLQTANVTINCNSILVNPGVLFDPLIYRRYCCIYYTASKLMEEQFDFYRWNFSIQVCYVSFNCWHSNFLNLQRLSPR